MKKDTLVKEGFFSRFLVMLVLIAALALLPGLLPTGEAFAANIVASGTCGAEGDNLTWTLDDEGLLTISGTGAMTDYDYDLLNTPWENCHDSILSIVIDDGVTSIGAAAFGFCRSLTGVNIPASVSSLGDRAFSNCYALAEIIIPAGVTRIGDYAFYGCNSLTSVTIPDSVTSIGSNAFYNCSSLNDVYYGGTEEQWETITIRSGNEYLIDATMHFTFIASGTCGDQLTWTLDSDGLLTISGTGEMAKYDWHTSPWYSNHDSIKSLVIGNGVTSIGDYAFQSCSSLTSVTIPASVTAIGISAFSGCSSVTSVTIPSSVTFLEKGVFMDCSNLTEVTIADGVTSISAYMFEGCERLADINIPESVTRIGDYALSGCTSLTSVTFGNGVTSIGDWAFANCDSLTSVTIPDSVASIGNNAFEYCDSLSDVYYGGTEEQWNTITIGNNNDPLTNAHFHFREIVASGTCGAQGDNLIWTLDNNGLLTISGTGEMNDYVSSAQMPGGYIIQVKP